MSRKRPKSAGGEDDFELRPKRSRGLPWKVPDALNLQLGLCPTLFSALRKCRDSENRNLTDQFMRAPSRRLYPTYYEVVDRPMDLMKIQQKVKTEVYSTLASFLADVQLILDNTRLFFQPLSTEYQQAMALEAAFTQTLKENGFVMESEYDSDFVRSPTELTLRIPKSHLQSSSSISSTSATATVSASTSTSGSLKVPSLKIMTSSLKQDGKATLVKPAASTSKLTCSETWIHDYLASNDPMKMIIAAIHNYHDPVTEDFIAEPFHQLPSRSQYPEYYRVIVQPIDLLTIRNNVEAGKYKNLKDIQEDLIIMVKNAHHFNVPGSEIFKKASVLRKFFVHRCSELEKKFQTVTATTDVAMKSCLEVADEVDSGEKKTPKLKISFCEKEKGCRQRSNVSSLSDLEEEAAISSSEEEDNSSNDDREDEGEEGMEGRGEEKLILHIKKDRLGSSRHACVDPVARLLRSRKSPSLKKRLLAVFQSVVNKTDADGRILSDIFMRRPSIKLYPEYYRVIKEPIDLREILERVRRRTMSSMQEMSQGMELMINNALTFNEENSQVYSDALVLREVAQTAIARIQKVWPHLPIEVHSNAPVTTTVQHLAGRGRPRKIVSTHHHPHTPPDVVTLFTTVKGHMDCRGRYLWHTFKQLPTGAGVPSDYYFTVKKPIDMNAIQNKMTSGVYLSLDQIMDDLTLLMDNALTFFPRLSQQSMDAVALQRIIISKYTQLKAMSGESLEDVNTRVQKILSDILSGTLTSQDSADCLIGVQVTKKIKVPIEGITKGEEGVVQSEKGLSESDEGVASYSFNFENIKAWMAAGDYRRLDQLQSDLCDVLCQASRHWRGVGVVNLGRQFIAARDNLCGEGSGQLWSPALSYTASDIVRDLDAAITSHSSKSPSPMSVSSPTTSESELHSLSGPIPGEDGEGMTGVALDVPGMKRDECSRCEWNGLEYQVGDVLYVTSCDVKPRKSHIVRVEKFWTDKNNSMCFDGTWFYRPQETFHVATKKFYKKEVFRSDFHGVAYMTQVVGKASILSIRDFPKLYPKGYCAEDVFVCESRYSYRTKQFRKIKNWIWTGVAPTLLMRDKPLSMTKVPSVFALGTTAGEEEEEEGPLDTPFVQPNPTNVLLGENPPFKYYEQYCIDEDCFRTGDFVYLRSDQESPFIARIERMWSDNNGDPWIHGPWFLRPREVEHAPTRTFYHQELLLSNIQDTNPMRSISGRCLVLFYNDYCKKRPTGYAESDVYVCLSRYNEVDKEIKRAKGWKTFQHSDATRKDEVYYFTTDLQLTKVASPKLFTKEFNPVEDPIQLSHVKATPTVTSSSVEEVPIVLGGGKTPKGISITPQFLQQLLATASKMSAMRPVVSSVQLPCVTSSSTTTSTSTTQLAQALMSSSSVAAKLETATQVPPNKQPTELAATPPPQPKPPQLQQQPQQQPQQQQLFRCYWETCSAMFSVPLDLYTHVVGPGPSHISKEVEGSYFCRWKNCPRSPSNVGGRSFDTINKIIRHMKEVHLMKLSALFGIGVRAGGIPRLPTPAPPTPSLPATPVNLLPYNGRPLPPKTTPSFVKTTPFSSSPLPTPTPAKTTPPVRTVADIFIPPPENRQSLIHTDIYLRYIQGMKANSSHLSSNVDSATLRSTNQTDSVSLPKAEEWFSADAIKTIEGGESSHVDGVATLARRREAALLDALWALRDHMNKESWKLASYLDTDP